MASFQQALQYVLEHNINLLTQLGESERKLDQELETLNSMTEDTETELRAQEKQPGRKRKKLVDKRLKDVEQINKKTQDTKNQTNEILAYESYEEVFEELLKEVQMILSSQRGLNPHEPSSSATHNHGLKIEAEKISNVGMGGVGETTINNTGCNIKIESSSRCFVL